MVFSLAAFPVEVLSIITSYLSGQHVLIYLPLCGNSILNTRLATGGVKILYYTLPRLPENLINLAASYRLESVVIKAFPCPIQAISLLIRRLPSNLRHLAVFHGSISTLLRTSELDISSGIVLSSSAHAPWIVSETFPTLESFSLKGGPLALDFFFRLRFILGLPPTLRFLSLDAFAHMPDFWNLLPPHLISLEDVRGSNIPWEKSRLENIQTLKLCFTASDPLTTPKSLPYQLPTANDIDSSITSANLEDLARLLCPMSDASQLVLPSTLTSLHIETNSETLPTRFPSGLQTLNWRLRNRNRNAKIEPLEPYSILHRLPTSLTSLSLLEWHFALPHSPNPEHTNLLLPSIASLVFDFSATFNESFTESKFYHELLRPMPNLVSVEIRNMSLFITGLEPEHLSYFNNSLLRTLTTTLSQSTLSHGNARPLREMLPDLSSLSIRSCSSLDPETFSFADMPPNLTFLDLHNLDVTTKTLHLLPSSVTDLRAVCLRVLVSHENFHRLFFPSLLPSAPSALTSTTQDANMSLEPPSLDMTTLNLSSSMQWKSTYDALSHSPTSTSFVSHPKYYIAHDKNYENNNLGLRWIFENDPLPLPAALTRLTLNESTCLSHVNLTPSALPHLTYLNVHGTNDSIPDIGSFTNLKTLKFSHPLPTQLLCSWPPHLEHLTCVSIHPDSPPLPRTLTKLSIEGWIIPNLSSLITLKIFSIYRFGAKNDLGLLPSSITDLTIDVSSHERAALASLSTRFPHLARLTVLRCGSIAIANAIKDSFSSHVSLLFEDPLDSMQDIHLLAPNEGIRLDHCDTLNDWVYLQLKRLHMMLPGEDEKPSVIRFLPSSWSSFTSLLSPTLTELDLISTKEALPPDFAAHLPRSLTFLALFSIKSPRANELSQLPMALETFIVREKCLSSAQLFEALPRGLKRLEFSGPPLLESETTLPPQLTHLSVKTPHAPSIAILKNLPSSITYLEFDGNGSLSTETFAALPAALRLYKGKALIDFYTFAKSRGILWVDSPNSVNQYHQSNTFEVLRYIMNNHIVE